MRVVANDSLSGSSSGDRCAYLFSSKFENEVQQSTQHGHFELQSGSLFGERNALLHKAVLRFFCVRRRPVSGNVHQDRHLRLSPSSLILVLVVSTVSLSTPPQPPPPPPSLPLSVSSHWVVRGVELAVLGDRRREHVVRTPPDHHLISDEF